MSAISAIKGYRTQFLYSLFHILSNSDKEYIFKLEGEEDLDILDKKGSLLFAIQIKNLAKPITLSDILTEHKTSFVRRFLEKYSTATPVLVSFGSINSELKNWQTTKNKTSQIEKGIIRKYKLTEEQWKSIKKNIEFREVSEENIVKNILDLLKAQYPFIDPEPTAENILYWLQLMAEKQISITSKELFGKIEEFGLYLTERHAITEQYGLVLKPLHKISIENANTDRLKEEFYYGITARYEHILLDVDVERESFLAEIKQTYKEKNIVVIKGASGQGKSTLAYRYAYKYAPETLAFELNIQQDPIASQKSIQAISSITKHLNTPVLFLIHVLPNTIGWTKIVKEFAHYAFVHFLITIRSEDWYKATATGIDFIHSEIKLMLTKNEAEMIYNRLNAKNLVLHYADFEEAWIKIGPDIPMLEFIYSITQGDSLRNKLKQQVLQIANEDALNNNDKQSEFLRLVSLADSMGAKIDIKKIDTESNLQFIIERFEKEYLIKKSGDNKYILGLHPVRSEILANILFDEFINTKRNYTLKSLLTIADEDTYIFLLQSLYRRNVNAIDIIEILTAQKINLSWTTLNNIQKGLMWQGTREYVEDNKLVLDECYNTYGDTWIMMMDISHGNTFDIESFLERLPFGDNLKIASKQLNTKLSDKKKVYKYVTHFFERICLPNKIPFTELDWSSFGELIFWAKQLQFNSKFTLDIPEEQYEKVFQTLSIEKLSKLMLGMFYSENYNSIRLKFAPYFITRLQERFKIPLILVDDEITVHFLVDILKEKEIASLHDKTIELIDLLRDAFPDKQKFNTQGHGHRLQLISMPHDATCKEISINNLPLAEWVSINATSSNLYEFSKRPKNWEEYHKILNHWEYDINNLIMEFNTAFSSHFKKNNEKDYTSLIPLMNNANYSSLSDIKAPQSISDYLGIYFDSRQKSLNQNTSAVLLKTKYHDFFKHRQDFRRSIENFIVQSGRTIYEKLDEITNPNKEHNEDFESLSLTNLFDAIQKHVKYSKQKQVLFQKFSFLNIAKINTDTLLTSAILWKHFLIADKKKFVADSSSNKFHQIKSDFETRILKGCKIKSKINNITIRYINNQSTNNKPVLLINTHHPILSFSNLESAYNIVKEAIDNPDYSSLKYLMLKIWFPEVYFIQLIEGKPIYNEWHEMPLYLFIDDTFKELGIQNLIPKIIDVNIVKNLALENWSELFPKIDELKKLSEAFIQVRGLVEHLFDLKYFEKADLKEIGNKILQDHIQVIGDEIQRSFQYVLDGLFELLSLFPFDENKFNTDEFEQEYWNSLFIIRDNLFPTDKGDEEEYKINLDLSSIGNWIQRLNPCTDSWGVFTLLAYGKYIQLYKSTRSN